MSYKISSCREFVACEIINKKIESGGGRDSGHVDRWSLRASVRVEGGGYGWIELR